MSMWKDAKEEMRFKEDKWWNDGYKAGVIDGYEKGKADAVPVVRCKDCRWHTDEEPGMVYCPKIVGGWVHDDWFCKDGERKDDEHTD